jgi:hypothetical protein
VRGLVKLFSGKLHEFFGLDSRCTEQDLADGALNLGVLVIKVDKDVFDSILIEAGRPRIR